MIKCKECTKLTIDSEIGNGGICKDCIWEESEKLVRCSNCRKEIKMRYISKNGSCFECDKIKPNTDKTMTLSKISQNSVNKFCAHCGQKQKTGAKFCHDCRKSSEVGSPTVRAGAYLYSKDWVQRGFFAFSIPSFDILVDNDYLYLIKLPRSAADTIGLLVGLVFANIIGAVVGGIIGKTMVNNEKKKFRLRWLDVNGQILNLKFEDHIFLKIPLKEINAHCEIKGNKLLLSYDDYKLKLAKSAEESNRIKSYIK